MTLWTGLPGPFRREPMLNSALLGKMRVLPPAMTFADRPNDGTDGEILFITDGRKSGEGAGTGTGVQAIWATPAGGGSKTWCRNTDYTAVVA